MNASMLQSVPTWVFGLFALLLALGVRQSFPQSLTLRRSTLLPIVLLAVSLAGVVSTFGPEPLALLAWATGVGASATLAASRRDVAAVRYDVVAQRFHVPGSWMPMALMMGLFAAKFVTGAALARQPALAASAPFAVAMSAFFGLFSGAFLGRAAALWTVARRAAMQPVAA
ncbi:MAG: hypothetical protein Fur0019_14140 [Tibeticola sp.]